MSRAFSCGGGIRIRVITAYGAVAGTTPVHPATPIVTQIIILSSI